MKDINCPSHQLFKQPPQFLKGVVGMAHLPAADRPEIAFAGRSNVGKSSLINALTEQKNLARASNTPGRTQELNFFSFQTIPAYLVDMPGYGYAKAPKEKVTRWTKLIKTYLAGRPNLRRVYLLIDSRHGIKAKDTEMIELLNTHAVSFQIVLTKCDKPGKKDLEKIISDTEKKIKKYPAAFPLLEVTSSQKKDGIQPLRRAIFSALTM